MPRGFHKDEQATKAANFLDRRSFVSLPKVTPHTNGAAEPHFLLYGKDKGPIRAEIFRRNRQENQSDVSRCWNCGVPCYEKNDFYRGEWHHVNSGAGERCDCVENSVVSCAKCHRAEHVQTQFGKTED